jgi:hypothetical protein
MGSAPAGLAAAELIADELPRQAIAGPAGAGLFPLIADGTGLQTAWARSAR